MLHTLSTDVADNVRFTVFNIYQAESRSYREQYLEQASIFINRLDRLPGNVEEVLRFVAGQHPLRQSDYVGVLIPILKGRTDTGVSYVLS